MCYVFILSVIHGSVINVLLIVGAREYGICHDQLCRPLYTAPPMAPCQISNPSAENWWKKNTLHFGVSLLQNFLNRQLALFSVLTADSWVIFPILTACQNKTSVRAQRRNSTQSLGWWCFLKWSNLLSNVIITEPPELCRVLIMNRKRYILKVNVKPDFSFVLLFFS